MTSRKEIWRLRSARVARRIADRLEPPPPPAPPEPEVEPEPPVEGPILWRNVPAGTFVGDSEPVSTALVGRLSPELIGEIDRLTAEAAETPDFQSLPEWAWDDSIHAVRLLHFGAWFDVPGFSEQTGITVGIPPEEIHVMARGPLAAVGGIYEADLVVAALRSTGIDPGTLRSGLDFGCSSGRVLRVLQAMYPDIRWFGCDPNAPAIEWASENLPGMTFEVSGNRPPLSHADASLDLVFAISIWSHFEPALGLEWFDEMARILAPGGVLVMTTHGLVSIDHQEHVAMRPTAQLLEIKESLYRDGWWYLAEFGPEGDWGVINPDWGAAFLSPEWVLSHLTPRWEVLEYAPGRNASNQDVYVLRRTAV